MHPITPTQTRRTIMMDSLNRPLVRVATAADRGPGWHDDGKRLADGTFDTRGGRGLIRPATPAERAQIRRKAAKFGMDIWEYLGEQEGRP